GGGDPAARQGEADAQGRHGEPGAEGQAVSELRSDKESGDAMNSQGPSPALFFDTISAYQRTEALRAAIELDLFTQVAAGHQTVTELANACQAAPRGVRILADYLTILGFLHKQGDRYELSADAKAFLDRQSPAYLGGTL